jgi:hypothetical protein
MIIGLKSIGIGKYEQLVESCDFGTVYVAGGRKIITHTDSLSSHTPSSALLLPWWSSSVSTPALPLPTRPVHGRFAQHEMRIPAWSTFGVSIGVPRGPLPGRPPHLLTSNQPLNIRDADVGKVRAEKLSRTSTGSLYGRLGSLSVVSRPIPSRRFLPHVVIHGRPENPT